MTEKEEESMGSTMEAIGENEEGEQIFNIVEFNENISHSGNFMGVVPSQQTNKLATIKEQEN